MLAELFKKSYSAASRGGSVGPRSVKNYVGRDNEHTALVIARHGAIKSSYRDTLRHHCRAKALRVSCQDGDPSRPFDGQAFIRVNSIDRFCANLRL